MDFVRRNEDESFVPAVNIPSLFTVRAAANSSFRRTVSMASVENGESDSKKRTRNPSIVDDQKPLSGQANQCQPSVNAATDLRNVLKPNLTSFVANLVHDRNSIGLSAVVVIGIVVFVWAAGL